MSLHFSDQPKSNNFFHSFLSQTEPLRQSKFIGSDTINESARKSDTYQVNFILHQAEKMKLFKPADRLKISTLQTPGEIITAYRKLPDLLKKRYRKYFQGIKFKWTVYNYDYDQDENKLMFKDTPSLDQPHIILDCQQPERVFMSNELTNLNNSITITGIIQGMQTNRLEINCLELS
ncbi:MAG: hypothetical protein OHK0017_13410 [Patescibacteria group bacterium]